MFMFTIVYIFSKHILLVAFICKQLNQEVKSFHDASTYFSWYLRKSSSEIRALARSRAENAAKNRDPIKNVILFRVPKKVMK